MFRSAAFVEVSILPSGFLTLPEHRFCANQHDESVRNTVPSMSFLLQHPTTGHKIVFDLGLRRDLNLYPENIRPHLESRQPIYTVPDVGDSLRAGSLQPSEIDAVVLSHVHYDHVGTPTDFAKAKFIVGYGTRHLLKFGMNYHSAAKFEPDLLPMDRIIELPIQNKIPKHKQPVENTFPPTRGLTSLVPILEHQWRELHPFDNVIDLYGDGLVYLVDSPGHIPGHINLLAKVGKCKWVYLAGDACHHKDILDGMSEMATWWENGLDVCIHVDRELAEDTVQRIRMLRDQGVEHNSDIVDVVLAHDLLYFRQHQYAIWPGSLNSLGGHSKI
ncbi:Metallo-hydrolase/oxidoreductase [Aaosphaeria arxii CBS 175.79]|uniref:Metallo-hydrolase/oxidoreductase n=1 Tax=Aaosphaeria arxii CBS 175.79 TaxID=1450172 RepID=A0A6A5Y0Z5_9PLEO|nr:Metallo-hydrolase/oxidoreductase [Aaosphaeria arxii CBS 175.79]KAF2018234.1 Metallo-hydrolase/oxidoreductase [Aaosphaeria arxii CBS 175.79]